MSLQPELPGRIVRLSKSPNPVALRRKQTKCQHCVRVPSGISADGSGMPVQERATWHLPEKLARALRPR